MTDTMSEEFTSSNLRQKHTRQLMKTEMCKFFLANKCGKGSRCQFAHSASEIREKPDLNRTSMCRSFLQTGTCENPSCCYAHSERELRTTTAFFKTRMCRFASSGRCKHGSACRFAHNPDELTVDNSNSSWQQLQLRGGPSSMMMQLGSLPSPPEDSYMGNFLQQGRGSELATDWGSNNSGSQQGDAGAATYAARLDQGSDHNLGGQSSTQSTRAETSASVSTPEGSGDSGQEEFSRGGQRGTTDALGRRTGRRVGERHCTTIMITNVPNFLTQGALISLLEDLTQSMRGAFDFFYCPWDPCHDCNLGYAIVNFFSRLVAAEFERQWTNQPLLPKSHNARRLRIVPAALQGRAANLRHFSSFSLAEHADPRFRPLVRANPQEALKPMVTCRELQEQQQQHQQQQQQYEDTANLESPRDDMMYDNGGNGPVMQGTGACQPFVPIMPANMQFSNEGMVGLPQRQFSNEGMVGGGGASSGMAPTRVAAPFCGLPQRQVSGGGEQEHNVLSPAGMQQCWAWLLPPGANPGIAGAAGMVGSPAAVSGVPFYTGGLPMQATMIAQQPMRRQISQDGLIYPTRAE